MEDDPGFCYAVVLFPLALLLMSSKPLQLYWPTRHADEARADEGGWPCFQAEHGAPGQFGPHLLLEADNLDGLKWALAQKSLPRPKLILIDPPYNTDKQFFYTDRQTSRARTRPERRAAWLGFMLPRLILAHRWLDEAGVMLVHIDEHEAHYLQVLMTEVFGADNDLGEIVWDKRNPKGDATGISVQHETILAFAKDKKALKAGRSIVRIKPGAAAFLEKAESLMRRVGKRVVPQDLREAVEKYGLGLDLERFKQVYSLDDARAEFLAWSQVQPVPAGLKAYRFLDDQGEVFRTVSMAWPSKKQAPKDYFIPLVHPRTGKKCPVPERGWRNPPSTMQKLLGQGRIIFGTDEKKQPERKYLLRENMTENWASVVYYGGSDDARLKKIGVPFDTPKPVDLTKQLIRAFLSDGGMVCDFFAGSGTVGHAAMELAAEGFPVSSISMQWNEQLMDTPAARAGLEFCQKNNLDPTVFSLTTERLRRVSETTGQKLDVLR